MRRYSIALVVASLLPLVVPVVSVDASSPWQTAVPVSNQVASTPFAAGGYPVPDGATAPGARHVPAGDLRCESLRIVARCQAGHGGI